MIENKVHAGDGAPTRTYLSISMHFLGGSTVRLADDVDTALETVHSLTGDIVDALLDILAAFGDAVDAREALVAEAETGCMFIGEDCAVNLEVALRHVYGQSAGLRCCRRERRWS